MSKTTATTTAICQQVPASQTQSNRFGTITNPTSQQTPSSITLRISTTGSMPRRSWHDIPQELRNVIYSHIDATLFSLHPSGRILCEPPLDRADFTPEQPWTWWTAPSRHRLLSPLAARLEQLAITFYMLSGAEGDARLASVLQRLLNEMITDSRWAAGLVGRPRLREMQWWRTTNENVEFLWDFLRELRRPRLRWETD